jgi:tetraacyldisaccharide 4'-kinase
LNQNFYRNLISGSNDGFAKRLLRFLLRVVSIFYCAVVVVRNFCYDIGLIKARRVGSPVISVGNMTTGGTGKTPLVIWLCRLLEAKSVSCAVLTRGYKIQGAQFADEPAILAKSCPAAKVITDPDRIRAAKKAVGEFGSEVLVMDDGFQHRRLRRDLDIVAVDATCPFGYGRVLPAGLLREPISCLRRADVIVITRYDQVVPEQVQRIERTIKKIAPNAVTSKAVHRHPFAEITRGRKLSIAQLGEKTIFAFCGIGNPDAFLYRLGELGLSVVGSKVYNAHHNYTPPDVADICEQAKNLGADLILSTQKDLVKTALLFRQIADIECAYLAVELEFIGGVDKISRLVDEVITQEAKN